jgi:hypothetical protein
MGSNAEYQVGGFRSGRKRMSEDKEFWKDVYVAAIAAGCTSNEQAVRLENRALSDLHVAEKERDWPCMI